MRQRVLDIKVYLDRLVWGGGGGEVRGGRVKVRGVKGEEEFCIGRKRLLLDCKLDLGGVCCGN